MILLLPWIPFLGAILILLTPKTSVEKLKQITVGSCAASFAMVISLMLKFDPAQPGYQFVHHLPWIPYLGISYQVGLDGINLVLIILHGLVSFSGALVSVWDKPRIKEYLFFYLLLVGAIYGLFTSLDVFLMYVYYELTLIPLYPMIAIWGSKNKEYGAMKLTLFITAGAVLSLFGIIVLMRKLGVSTFDYIVIQEAARQTAMSSRSLALISGFFLLGFGVIASLWPVHSWSPIGYAAAPTSVSMLHAGVLKKMGPYLILRLAVGLLPQGVQHWSNLLAVLAVVGILYAGYAALKQTDLKFIIGFSSVSHMGYILLAIAVMNPAALSGAVLLMFSHGVMAAATFAIIGFLYEQTHHRDVKDYGGIAKKTPFISIAFIMAAMASLGLPGFSNFAAEVLIFIGGWPHYPWIICFAVFGILITALYLLRMVKQVCYGPLNPQLATLKDASTFIDRFPFILLLGALLLFGFWPQGLLRFIEPAVGALLR